MLTFVGSVSLRLWRYDIVSTDAVGPEVGEEEGIIIGLVGRYFLSLLLLFGLLGFGLALWGVHHQNQW